MEHGPAVPIVATTDDQDEVFDLVDGDDRVIGQVRRGDAHRNPALMHRSVQVLVFTSDGSLLLQRRSRSKDLFPGYFCASASGHVAAGEDYDVTAHRELREELGIDLPLQFLAKTLIASEVETEMTTMYLAQSDGPFHFHPSETDGGILCSLAEVREAVETHTMALTPALVAAIAAVSRLGPAGSMTGPRTPL